MKLAKKLLALNLALILSLSLLPLQAHAASVGLSLGSAVSFEEPSKDGYTFNPTTAGIYTVTISRTKRDSSRVTTPASCGSLVVYGEFGTEVAGMEHRGVDWSVYSYSVPMEAGKTYTIAPGGGSLYDDKYTCNYSLSVSKENISNLSIGARTSFRISSRAHGSIPGYHTYYYQRYDPHYFAFTPSQSGWYTFTVNSSDRAGRIGELTIYDSSFGSGAMDSYHFWSVVRVGYGSSTYLQGGQTYYLEFEANELSSDKKYDVSGTYTITASRSKFPAITTSTSQTVFNPSWIEKTYVTFTPDKSGSYTITARSDGDWISEMDIYSDTGDRLASGTEAGYSEMSALGGMTECSEMNATLDLAGGTTYYIGLLGVRDYEEGGNTISVSVSYNGGTGTALITGLSPANGAKDVDSDDTKFLITFDREIASGEKELLAKVNFDVPGAIKIYRAADDKLIYPDPETQHSYSQYDYHLVYNQENVLSISPINRHTLLEPGTEYYITMGEGFITFADGSTNQAIKKGEWVFKTATIVQTPIIVIPGIMGSRLYSSDHEFTESTTVWDPSNFSDITQLSKYMSGTLYVRPCEDQNAKDQGTVAEYGREYGAQNTYKKIVDALCKEFPERKVYFFSYDWRNSNSESAFLLKKFIDSLNVEKVDLVCHSMGGLVASSYYSTYASDGKVDKIITCGTPYEGAPKLLNSVQNWDVLGTGYIFSKDDLIDVLLGTFGGMTKKVKSSFLGVAELLPTQNYVAKTPMWRDSWKPFNIGDYELTYREYADICREIFAKNYDSATKFQQSILDASGYNALLNYANSYFILGINNKTITSIKFQFSNADIDQQLYESDLNYSMLGDGTVPYLSASIMGQVEKLPLYRWTKYSVNHNGTINDDGCIKWIILRIKNDTTVVLGDNLDPRPYTVLRIACPVEVKIEQGDEYLSSALDNLSTQSSFGRLDIIGENDEIKMLCLDSGVYDVVMNGTDTGTMDFSIRFFDANENLYSERVIEDVPITEDSIIYTNTDESGETVLEIDSNGDGIIDDTLTAERIQVQPQVPSTPSLPTNPSYPIKVADAANGTVTVTPTSAEFGSSITITAVPDADYTTGKVTVTDLSGKSVPVTDNGDGTYTFTMPASLATVSVTFERINRFTDVSKGSWYYDAVDYVARKDLMRGTSTTIFEPNTATTRAMIVTILYRLEKSPAAGNVSFDDVNAGTWYTDAVAWASANGIVKGYGNGKFGPGDPITREQVAAILYRYAEYKGYDISGQADLTGYTDAKDVSGWALTAMRWANDAGLITGRTAATLAPDGTTNRAEAAAILMRFCQKVAGLE